MKNNLLFVTFKSALCAAIVLGSSTSVFAKLTKEELQEFRELIQQNNEQNRIYVREVLAAIQLNQPSVQSTQPQQPAAVVDPLTFKIRCAVLACGIGAFTRAVLKDYKHEEFRTKLSDFRKIRGLRSLVRYAVGVVDDQIIGGLGRSAGLKYRDGKFVDEGEKKKEGYGFIGGVILDGLKPLGEAFKTIKDLNDAGNMARGFVLPSAK